MPASMCAWTRRGACTYWKPIQTPKSRTTKILRIRPRKPAIPIPSCCKHCCTSGCAGGRPKRRSCHFTPRPRILHSHVRVPRPRRDPSKCLRQFNVGRRELLGGRWRARMIARSFPIVLLGTEAETKQQGNAHMVILRYRRRKINVVKIDDQRRRQGEIVG